MLMAVLRARLPHHAAVALAAAAAACSLALGQCDLACWLQAAEGAIFFTMHLQLDNACLFIQPSAAWQPPVGV